jgi:flagellar hook assembly protein FlgD
MGQKVRTLIDEELPAGPHRLEWNGKNLSNEAVPSGIYFYMMETDSFVESKKMTLVK